MISIFGASVTQQKKGFAYRLKEKLGQDVQVFGYGGMHLNNAGVCYLDKIVDAKPSYCLIDWFSTDYNLIDQKTEEYIDTIISKLIRIKCKPIFLFLPFRNNDKKIIFHEFCRDILERRNVAYIDITSQINQESIDLILRDYIHTTDYGSELYSKTIADEFVRIDDNSTQEITEYTEYTEIHEIEINRVFDKIIKLKGECEIIGFLLTIGPHSGIVKITKNKKEISTENTWDRWCNYNRKHFNLAMSLSGNAELVVLQESFDTSVCEKRDDFSSIRKKLILHSVFYIGKELLIENIDESKPINNNLILFRNSLERIKQKIITIANKGGIGSA